MSEYKGFLLLTDKRSIVFMHVIYNLDELIERGVYTDEDIEDAFVYLTSMEIKLRNDNPDGLKYELYGVKRYSGNINANLRQKEEVFEPKRKKKFKKRKKGIFT